MHQGYHFQSHQNAVIWLTENSHGKCLNWFYGLSRFKGVHVSQKHKFNGKLCFLKVTLVLKMLINTLEAEQSVLEGPLL